MQIKQVAPGDVPMQLLLEADPSLQKVNGYLSRSCCFVAIADDLVVGACVVKATAPDMFELMNISVAPTHQRQRIGTQLLKHAISYARERNAARMEVGTGAFGYQLAFYQREGFRVQAIDVGFFLDYPEPVYEDGIQHKDMLRLVLEF